MVKLTNQTLARGPTLIYGVKRGKIPMSLRPVPPPQGRRTGRASCLEELAALNKCWKTANFEDSHCQEEIHKFLECARVAIPRRNELLKAKPKDQYKQMKELLSKFTEDKRGAKERKF